MDLNLILFYMEDVHHTEVGVSRDGSLDYTLLFFNKDQEQDYRQDILTIVCNKDNVEWGEVLVDRYYLYVKYINNIYLYT